MASTSRIGSGSRNYATIDLWWGSIPATLTQDEIGEMYNDSELVATATISLTGKTLAGFTITLRAAAGQGFAAAAGGAGFKLQYDATQGAAVTSSTGYIRPLISAPQAGLTIDGLQFRTTTSNSTTVVLDSGATIKNCIIDCACAVGGSSPPRLALSVSNSASKAINCLIVARHATDGSGVFVDYGPLVLNCTAVKPSSVGASGTGFIEGGGTSVNIVRNCASFNFTTAFTSTGWESSSNYNCAGDTTAPGANSQQSKTYANQFQDTTQDWRLKTGADCIDHGNTDATNAPNDIIGTVRGATTLGDIGAWEYAEAAGGGWTGLLARNANRLVMPSNDM